MTEKESARLSAICHHENKHWQLGRLAAGIDEVGRGPLAGPCVAAAVIMPQQPLVEGVNDSKKVSEKKRPVIYEHILDTAISVGIGIVSSQLIDEINILNATRQAFASAYNNLDTKPSFVLCDKIGGIDIDCPYEEFVGGDALSYSIAAASIIAKVTRDEMMRKYDEQYPGYNFSKNKGYGTAEHIDALKRLGPCPIHRMSFLTRIL